MIGGKLAAYRSMRGLADVAAARVATARCAAHPVPGAEAPLPDVDAIADTHRVPSIAVVCCARGRGARGRVLDAGGEAGRGVLCPCEPVLACE